MFSDKERKAAQHQILKNAEAIKNSLKKYSNNCEKKIIAIKISTRNHNLVRIPLNDLLLTKLRFCVLNFYSNIEL